jgi:hypothetical protein
MVGYYKQAPAWTIEDGFGGIVDGFSGLAKKRYPWRLAPYLDFALQGTMLTGERESLMKAIPPVDDRTWWHYRISTMPSFGLNAHFLGGYEYDRTSPPPFHVVHMMSQVKLPSDMLAFASARGEDWDSETNTVIAAEGWHTVDSPAWGHTGTLGGLGYPWSAEAYSRESHPEQHGNISARYRDKVLLGFIDGHASTSPPEGLRDMRLWSNDAASASDPEWKPNVK